MFGRSSPSHFLPTHLLYFRAATLMEYRHENKTWEERKRNKISELFANTARSFVKNCLVSVSQLVKLFTFNVLSIIIPV